MKKYSTEELTQKGYIIERMDKYLMKYDLYELLDLYVKIKAESVEKGD